jgi:hypothetical protein
LYPRIEVVFHSMRSLTGDIVKSEHFRARKGDWQKLFVATVSGNQRGITRLG